MTITSDESFIILTTVTLSFEAELNLPYYPLLRRSVDCIIALDASADSQVWRNSDSEVCFLIMTSM